MGSLERNEFLKFDQVTCRMFNRNTSFNRIHNLLANTFVYHVDDLLRVISHYVSEEAIELSFKDFEIGNFHIVGHDLQDDCLKLFSRQHTPDTNIARVIATSAFPRQIGTRRFCQELEGYERFSDFDCSGKKIRREFFNVINNEHAEGEVHYLNIFTSGQRGNIKQSKISLSRFPRRDQLRDLVCALLNIENSTYGKTYGFEF